MSKKYFGGRMSREDLIKALTRYELDWYVHNSEGYEDDTAEFFAKGGFNTYTDEELSDEYSKNIAPEGVSNDTEDEV